MGFLNLFKKHIEETPPQPAKAEKDAKDISACDQMRVEVSSTEGQPLFIAKMINPEGTTAELRQYTEAELPQTEEPIPVRIRSYRDREKQAIYMEGFITPKAERLWLAKDLTVLRAGNERAFYRLSTNVEASVIKFNGQGAGERSCRLLNISVGGVRLSVKQQYWEGDKLLLNVRLFGEQDITSMFCQVLRVIDKGGGLYEYGCQFLELTASNEEKLAQNIFALQRKLRISSQ